MKHPVLRRLAVLLFTLMIIATPYAPLAAQTDGADPEINAEYAVIFNADDSGEILYRKNADQPVYCGFLPRAMVSLLLTEAVSDLDTTFTIPNEVSANTPQLSSARLAAGETISYRDLLVCINTVNSQEAAVAAAFAVAGSLPAFIDKMNARAKELGANDTVFTNVTGLYAKDTRQITTLNDCAKILTEALKHEEIIQSATQRTAKVTVNGKERMLYTKNMVIEPTSSYYHSAARGLFVYSESGNNSAIATSLVNDGGRLVSVAIGNNGMSSLYADANALLTYSKSSYAYFTLLEKGKAMKEIGVKYGEGRDYVILITADQVRAYLPKIYTEADVELIYDLPDQLTAPVEKDAVIGTVTVKCAGKEYGTVDLKTQSAVRLDNFELYSDRVRRFFANPYFWAVLGGIFLLVGGYILLTYRMNRPRKHRSRSGRTRSRVRMEIPEDDD